MKARHTFFLCAAAFATLIFSACEFNGGSIYATIEAAKKTIDSSLAKTLTVQDLVRAPGPSYYVAAGAIYEGIVPVPPVLPSTEGDIIQWVPPLTPPVAGQVCTSLVFLGGRLWGAFFNPDDSTFGLYRSNATPSFAGAIADPLFAGKQIMLLQVTTDGKLFAVAGAVTSNPYVFELYYSDDGVTWSPTPLLSGLSSMINGVAWDGTQYWVVGGTTAYTFTPGNPPTPIGTFTSLPGINIGSATQLNGVFTDGARIFIPSKNGGVYYSPDRGSTWIQFEPDSISSNTVGYLTVAGPVDGSDIYLVGADGYGYYYLSVSGRTLTRFNDSTILLYSAAVRRILIDPGISVFMGTAGGGLWRATFPTGTSTPDNNGWIHE